ncbi:reverse transcriptase domain-containing protein [Tanacetum coccineum]|uniref:Reverse transcriptase domain-containing protein n=1 Tax=Tanacetum coccineum TaxID=301880 RepID=A0ABQ5GL59_9ASTR
MQQLQSISKRVLTAEIDFSHEPSSVPLVDSTKRYFCTKQVTVIGIILIKPTQQRNWSTEQRTGGADTPIVRLVWAGHIKFQPTVIGGRFADCYSSIFRPGLLLKSVNPKESFAIATFKPIQKSLIQGPPRVFNAKGNLCDHEVGSALSKIQVESVESEQLVCGKDSVICVVRKAVVSKKFDSSLQREVGLSCARAGEKDSTNKSKKTQTVGITIEEFPGCSYKGYHKYKWPRRQKRGGESTFLRMERRLIRVIIGLQDSHIFFEALKSVCSTDKEIYDVTADAEKASITRGATQLSKIGEAHISPRICCKKTPKDDKIKTNKVESKKEGPKLENIWKLYTDGASSYDGSGAGLMLISLEGKEYTYALRLNLRPRITKQINQVKGLFEAMQPAIKQYLERMKEVLMGFDTYSIEHIQRNQNKKVDKLNKLALMTFEHLTKEVLVEVLANRSINDKEMSTIAAEIEENWMTPIYEYLISSILLEDPKEARKVRIKAP